MSWLRPILIRAARLASLPLLARHQRFVRLCDNPETIQAELLQRIVSRQTQTGFGQDHGFGQIRSIADYRRHVPIAPYEHLAPYIERVQAGDTQALLANDPLKLFALTSGTTASRKLIPITERYLKNYKRGWNLWGIRAYRDHRVRSLALRPILQMVGDPEEYRTAAGIPCGNLSGYTATVQKRLIRKLYCVPAIIGKIRDTQTRYYTALRMSVSRPVAMLLAANPSTLIALARSLNRQREQLLRDLHDGTLSPKLEFPQDIRAVLTERLRPQPEHARRLSAIAEKLGRLYPQDVWHPDTILIGTWTGGSMAPYLRQLPEFYGNSPIRDLGLLASEGRFTIPFANDTPAGVLDIQSHFFEFVPEAEADDPTPTVLGAHELSLGQSYFLVPTTESGLYRYQISDLVRVTGFIGRTPMVEFLGKGNRFANLTGEKLSEHQVTQSVAELLQKQNWLLSGYVLAPIWDEVQPYYAVLVERTEPKHLLPEVAFLHQLDQALAERNIEYQAKRESGRLGPLRMRFIEDGSLQKWDQSRLQQSGGSPEQYKRPCLVGDLQFAASFPTLQEVRTPA